jgi:hypothetical protein
MAYVFLQILFQLCVGGIDIYAYLEVKPRKA